MRGELVAVDQAHRQQHQHGEKIERIPVVVIAVDEQVGACFVNVFARREHFNHIGVSDGFIV